MASTSKPSADFDTRGRRGSVVLTASSLAAKAGEDFAQLKAQPRTVLMLVQRCRVRRDVGTQVEHFQVSSRASCNGWRTPTSLSISSKARSGGRTIGAPVRFSKGGRGAGAPGDSSNSRFRWYSAGNRSVNGAASCCPTVEDAGQVVGTGGARHTKSRCRFATNVQSSIWR